MRVRKNVDFLPVTLRGQAGAYLRRQGCSSEISQLHEEALQWAEASVRQIEPANDPMVGITR